MTPPALQPLLEDLSRRNVRLWADGGDLRFRAPKGAMTSELMAQLTARKGELLSFLRQRETGSAPVRIVPRPEELGKPFPLTEIQQAYWVGQSSAFELGNAAAHFYLENEFPEDELLRHAGPPGDEPVDVEQALVRFRRAWQRLAEHHPMLRMVVLPDSRQQILEDVPRFELQVHDLRREDDAGTERALVSIRERMAHQGPPTDRWPLFEVGASLLRGQRVRFHFSISLLICDALSFPILFDDLLLFYRDPEASPPRPELSYRDYVLGLEELGRSAAYQESLAYWRARLPTLPGAPELPLARQPGTLAAPRFQRHQGGLGADDWQCVKQRARAAGLTGDAVLLAAYGEVLRSYCRDPRFTINVLFFNRAPMHPDVERLLGNFSSTLLLEVDGSGRRPLLERARALQGQLWRDIEHSRVTGVRVLRELRRSRGNARILMPIVYASTLSLPGGAAEDESPEGTASAGGEVFSGIQTPQVWLDHQVRESRGALQFNWDVVEELFPRGMIPAMFEAYCAQLRRLATEEAAWNEPTPPLLPPEQLVERSAANATSAPVSARLLHELVRERFAERAAEPAVITPRRTLLYGELEPASRHLAGRLCRHGARVNRLVAVVMEKGWEQVVAVLGILEAGAAYLPIDPGLPTERLHYLLRHSEVELAVTQPWIDERLDWPAGVERLVVGEETSESASFGPWPKPLQGSRDLAYVIYTSGSTGQPKGVMIDHRGAVNTILDVNRRLGVGPGDRVFAISSLSFDLSVYDIFGTLAAGGAIVLPEAGDLREPGRWHELVVSAGVTVWSSVPALMEMLVGHLEERGARLGETLRWVMMSGDWIPVSLPRRIRALAGDIRLLSLGGATEASIWSILYPIGEVEEGWSSIPYGRPMTNQSFHVLDDELKPCPVWVPGQLFIGGVGLARGYWREEEKTRASFFEHPRTGEPLYRTGDLGRYLPGGDIEFLGREDFQVKVQGYRIELGEIEAALLEHPQVRQAVVEALGKRHGGKRLVAYLVPEADARLDGEEVKSFLRRKLPEYMVVATVVVLEALPLSANGKVDRRALPAPEALAGAPRGAEPRDDVERQLLEIFRQLLGHPAIGVTDSFFELGGDSLLAVRLMGQIERQTGRALPLSILFEGASIEHLAERLRREEAPETTRALVAVRPGGSAPPFFAVHPVGGSVVCYAELARRVDREQPFYALQNAAMEDGADRTVEEMARRYIEEVRDVATEGPYSLGGWSMGGVVAFEMARQLRAAGEEVALVAMIDVSEPAAEGAAERLDDATLAAWFAHDLGQLSGRDLDLGADELRPLAPEEQLARLVDVARQAGVVAADVEERQIARFLEAFRRNYRALLSYTPRQYPGALAFLRTDGEAGVRAAAAWNRFAAGGLDEHLLAGDHYTIMRPPGVDVLAERLQHVLSGRSTAQPTGEI